MALVEAIPIPVAEIEAHAEDMIRSYEKLFNKGDLNSLIPMYANDAIAMAPNQPMLQGPKAIRALYSAMLDLGCKNMRMEITRMIPDATSVTVCGTYSLDVVRPSLPKWTDRGKYVCVHRLEAPGVYKVAVEIWNTDLPK